MSINNADVKEMNRGVKTAQRLFLPQFPRADIVLKDIHNGATKSNVDILLVNPPAPDGGIWIRSQHRVGRRSREGMIWPQVSLAQMAALFPDYQVDIIDAIPHRMSWSEFEALLDAKHPKYYITQVTAPTLQNDMLGVFLAKARGATTIAFGTHVTPLPESTLTAFPALDFVLVGEPELTLRELVDTMENSKKRGCVSVGTEKWWPDVNPEFSDQLKRLFVETDPDWSPAWCQVTEVPSGEVFREKALRNIKGLGWRDAGKVVINSPRPFISNLDNLPLPCHNLLPLKHYRAPMVGGPYAFVVSSRGCPAGCRFCIKHVSYGSTVRFHSPEHVLDEIEQLVNLGIRKIHMYTDLFTVNREQVVGICEGILKRGMDVRWTCNSRVDFVDLEMLKLMHRAGCWMISWGIESGEQAMLDRMHKGITLTQVKQALMWAKQAGIMNWGYFIIGLPGETATSIRHTIDFAKSLPLDLVLFHIAAPHPGTPFFFEVVENGWFRPGTRWEEVDMDRSTVLDYPELSAEDLEHWAKRAFREWAFRPGPMWTYAKLLLGDPGLVRAGLQIGLETLGWK